MGELSTLATLVILSTFAQVHGGVIESRLLGSKDSENSSHLYHVALYRKGLLGWGKEEFVGSGALLDDRWLVTSAQIAEQIKPTWSRKGMVKAGLPGLESSSVQDLEVDKVVIHEFNNASGVADNDIALVKVKYPYFIVNELIKTIPYAEEEPKGQVVVTAWRAVYKDKKPRQELALDIKERISCGEALEHPEYIDETVFCVENTDKRAVCTDDVGSPAITVNGDQQYLVGIFSWVPQPEEGQACSTKPAIFTNIAKYSNWIRHNMS